MRDTDTTMDRGLKDKNKYEEREGPERKETKKEAEGEREKREERNQDCLAKYSIHSLFCKNNMELRVLFFNL